MLRRAIAVLMCFGILAPAVATAQAPAAQAKAPATQPKAAPAADRWEAEIAKFEAADKTTPPPKDAVLFVGSSSIRLWDLKKSFPDVAAINRGFGGSQMSDAARHARRLINVYKPRLIVLYEGDNDLQSKRTPEQVAADFDTLLKTVRADLPTTPMLVIGCKPSPSRWTLIEQQRATNRLLAERCTKDGHAQLLDWEKSLLGTDGQPRPELFRPDRLHLNEDGYKIWNDLLKPHLAAK